jgi:hypothetical protein
MIDFRGIVDLLMLRKQEKKLDIEIAKGPADIEKAGLEVEKLRREAQPKGVVIGPDQVSVDDIHKYDPRARQVDNVARDWRGPNPGPDHQVRYKRSFPGWIILLVVILVFGVAALRTALMGNRGNYSPVAEPEASSAMNATPVGPAASR